MAGRAASGPATAHTRHPLAKLSVVRVAMTYCASAVIEAVLRYILECRSDSGLVAIPTGNGDVGSCQIEPRALVHG